MDEKILEQVNTNHPLMQQAGINQDSINAVKQFVTTYGPYITIGLFLYKMYGSYKLNKTLTQILKKL